MSLVAITLFTYAPSDAAHAALAAERKRYAAATLTALFANLRPGPYDLWLHLADDGSAPEYREWLWEQAGRYVGANRSITNSERRGYGGNYNASTYVTHNLADVAALLPLEDDWELTRPLDLAPLVDVLHTDPRVGCIRMGYIGYSHPLRAEFIWTGSNPDDKHHFLLLDPNSPSQYVFSGGPRLETVAWARGVGPWAEGLPAGDTELAVCGRTAARTGVAWPVELVGPRGGLFEHVGTLPVKNAPLRREGVPA